MYYYGIIKTSQIFINLLVKDTKKKGTEAPFFNQRMMISFLQPIFELKQHHQQKGLPCKHR